MQACKAVGVIMSTTMDQGEINDAAHLSLFSSLL